MDRTISNPHYNRGRLDSMTGSLVSLEFSKVLERVASGAQSGSGRAAVISLEPVWSIEASAGLMGETLAAAHLMSCGIGPPAGYNDDLLEICRALEDGAIVLEPMQLRTVGEALEDQRRFLDRVRSAEEGPEGPGSLQKYIRPLGEAPGNGAHLLSITTPEGDLSPSASKEFARLHGEVEKLRKKLSRKINSICSSLSGGSVLRDMPPTLRDGRYVLPVIASKKTEVRGIVHDRSESGETIFIEPEGLVEDGNALREAALDLDHERRRILRESTMELRRKLPAVRRCADAAVLLDAVFARARYHLEMKTVFPDEGGLSLEELRHPLIPPDEMISNSITLPEDWKVLIVSGPNAGGKSVLLKAVGLAVACAQCGIGCMAGPGSIMPFFRRLHVSIGDRQSIADHQSTYSARLQEQLKMLISPGTGSLALIDEPAAGTDPLTGAALAASVLERLAVSGCRVMVTTHQGQLKSLAHGREGFYNGCMNFRNDTLEPDYTFIRGTPGSSFTLEIARRMGFPEEVLGRAQELSGDSFRLDRMLEEVTSARKKLVLRLQELERREREGGESLRLGMEELERERSELAAARETALIEMRELRRSINSRADSLLARLARSGSPDERRELREKIREISRVPREVPQGQEIDGGSPDGDIETGDWVSVRGWSGSGRVEEVGRDHVAVILGNLRLRKPLGEIRKVPPPADRPGSAAWSSPVEADTELDLRGMSSEEALAELERAVEDGLVAGVPFIRIIHGKGRGILMKAVVDRVRADPRVETFRPGKPPEGGTGVTIIHLRTPGSLS